MKRNKKITIMISILLMMSFVISMQNFSVIAAEVITDPVSGYSIVANNTVFYIKNAHSGQYLDLDHGKDENNANIHQWKYKGQKNQQWKFVIVGTVGDGCLYKIVSADSSSGRAIDVSKGGSANNLNIALYQYKGSTNQQFAIERTSFGAYKILSRCSGYKSGLTVKSKSCSQGANVVQYKYNGSHNDEWYLEPVNKSVSYGTKYAYSNAKNTKSVTYPYLGGIGGDCANFVSQCMAASGIHYDSDWFIYKKNGDYPRPTDINQFNNSWEVKSFGASPWISAPEFGNHWSKRVSYYTYTGKQLYDGKYVNDSIGEGDVVQYGKNGLWGYEGSHTMYITSRTNNTIKVASHSIEQRDFDLKALYNDKPNMDFRFYNVI